MKLILKTFANTNILIGIVLILGPITYMVMTTILDNNLLSSAYANSLEKQTQIVAQNPFKDLSENEVEVQEAKPFVEVPKDTVASYGNKIIIEKIGLDTEILESLTSSEALNKGVWRMPDFGMPTYTKQPTILAAHRWGADDASWDFRSKNLFLNIPDLTTGDQIKMIWEGEEYKYRVTSVEENVYVSKSDDLILLTCKYYDSDIRVIVYAEKI